MEITSQFPIGRHCQIFWRCSVFLVKLSYWSKFQINIISGSGVTTASFYKGLIRNPEIRNTPVKFWPIFGDWSKLGIPNLALRSLIKCYWMLKNTRVTAFTNSGYYKGKTNRGRGCITPTQPRLNKVMKVIITATLIYQLFSSVLIRAESLELIYIRWLWTAQSKSCPPALKNFQFYIFRTGASGWRE